MAQQVGLGLNVQGQESVHLVHADEQKDSDQHSQFTVGSLKGWVTVSGLLTAKKECPLDQHYIHLPI